MNHFLALFIFLVSFNSFAGNVIEEKTYNYKVVNGEGLVLDQQSTHVVFLQVGAGYTWGGCTDDCDQKFYWYDSESYKLIAMYREQGYVEAYESLALSELSLKGNTPMILALSKKTQSAFSAYLYLDIKAQLDILSAQ